MSNVSLKFTTEANSSQPQFKAGEEFNYRLKATAGGTWKIVGDVLYMKEEAYIDVLFIRAEYVTADDRTN